MSKATFFLVWVLLLGICARAQAQAQEQVPAQVQAEEPTFKSETFAEAFAFREYIAFPPDAGYETGILLQVEFFINATKNTRKFWVNCAADGKYGVPVARSESGDRVYVPYLACSFVPHSRQLGDGAPGDMTNHSRPWTIFYDRNALDGSENDVKVYVLGYRTGPGLELSNQFKFYTSVTANLLGARYMQFTREAAAGGPRSAGALQIGALNSEAGFVWNPNEKTTLTVSALGIQGHWGIGPSQGRFTGSASEIQYYTKGRLDLGDKVSLIAEYDWYRFDGQGLTDFNAFVVGAKVFTTNWLKFLNRK